MFGQLQWFVFLVLGVVVFAAQAVALVDAVRRPAQAFVAEGKLTKTIWLVILGIAAAIGFLGLPLPGGGFTSGSFFNVIAVVPAIVYWADVRPRLLPHGTGRKPRGPQGGW